MCESWWQGYAKVFRAIAFAISLQALSQPQAVGPCEDLRRPSRHNSCNLHRCCQARDPRSALCREGRKVGAGPCCHHAFVSPAECILRLEAVGRSNGSAVPFHSTHAFGNRATDPSGAACSGQGACTQQVGQPHSPHSQKPGFTFSTFCPLGFPSFPLGPANAKPGEFCM